MNAMIKMWSIMGGMDLLITVFAYQMLAGSSLVFLTIVPTILLLAIGLPIQRIGNQINKAYDRQKGKCFNCNLKMDHDIAVLEDNNHVYCERCHRSLYGHLYEQRNGVWYKKDE